MARFVLEYDYVAKAEVTIEAIAGKPGRDAIQTHTATITLHAIKRQQ